MSDDDRLAKLLKSIEPDAPPAMVTMEEALPRARQLVVAAQKASASHLQRRLRIGYNFAVALIERLEAEGTVGPPDHVGRRAVLASEDGEVAPARPVPGPPPGDPVAELAVQLVEQFGLDGAQRFVALATGKAGGIAADVMTALSPTTPREDEDVEAVKLSLAGATDEVRSDHLRQIVERVEALFATRDELSATIRDVFAFAKAIGFMPGIIRTCVKARAADPVLRMELEAMTEVYRHALGIEGPDYVIPLPTPSVPPPPKAKRITAKEKSYREVLALTAASIAVEHA